MPLAEHPTVVKVRSERDGEARAAARAPLDADWLRQLCLNAGADDVGFVAIERPEIDEQRADILNAFPTTQTLVSFVCRMNREPIRTPARSVANLEFHHTGDQVNEVAREIVATLEAEGIRALNPSMGFPMEMDHFPGKIWVVAHGPSCGGGGLKWAPPRNVIHPAWQRSCWAPSSSMPM